MPPTSDTEAVNTPVPDDAGGTTAGTPQLPWSSIPKFVPGTTNVQEYTQKLKFLAAMWPTEYLDQLAPRAALLVEGTAFRKVARLSPEKLRVKNVSGVSLLVDAIGGSWGSTELEERYEYFEKALYGTVQRSDESHDSYLARMESNFMELLSRDTKLEEVQAYVLLRQSLLAPDDKKKILPEHQGELRYPPVVKSFRLLGSKFFSELQGSKNQAKTRVYEAHVTEEADHHHGHPGEGHQERAFAAFIEDQEPDLEPEFIEALLATEDQDALIVSSFESELEDFLQDVPAMHEALVSYIEARSKLQEKRRTRGFWPVKGKKFSPKGKGRGKGKKDRESLLRRISRSFCRICDQQGHWKAECPLRDKSAEGSNTATANVAEAVVTMPTVHEVHSEPEPDADVVTRLKPIAAMHSVENQHDAFVIQQEDAFVIQGLCDPTVKRNLQNRMMKLPIPGFKNNPKISTVSCDTAVKPRYAKMDRSKLPEVLRAFRNRPIQMPETCHLITASDKPCHAILDTGASRCVIGENIWQQFLQQTPSELKRQFRQQDSQVKFRFGNNQTLQSEYKVQLPLKCKPGSPKRLWLSIEVLPGSTPFLFSKRAFKQLGGVLDTTDDTCYLHRLNRKIHLELNNTELYLLDVLKFCAPGDPDFTQFFADQSNHDGRKPQYGGTYVASGNHGNMTLSMWKLLRPNKSCRNQFLLCSIPKFKILFNMLKRS